MRLNRVALAHLVEVLANVRALHVRQLQSAKARHIAIFGPRLEEMNSISCSDLGPDAVARAKKPAPSMVEPWWQREILWMVVDGNHPGRSKETRCSTAAIRFAVGKTKWLGLHKRPKLPRFD